MIDLPTLTASELRLVAARAEAVLHARAGRVLHAIGAVDATQVPDIHRVEVNEKDVYVQHGLREENENWIPLATFDLLGRTQ